MRPVPPDHMRGLDEKIWSALAPSAWAISSESTISPAMDVWMPMRMLPSFQAGTSGAGGGSGRYSSDSSYCRLVLLFSSAIPSGARQPRIHFVRRLPESLAILVTEQLILAESR